MKKTFLLLSACAVVALGATSCSKDKDQPNGDFEFNASMENCNDADGKTTLNGTNILWSGNDTVMLYGRVADRYLAVPDGENSTSAKLRRLSNSGTIGTEVTAIYPAALANSATSVTLPATQVTTDGNLMNNFPMWAYTTNDNLAFKNVFGALKIHLQQTGATVSRIVVTADVEINGNFNITKVDGLPQTAYADGGSYTTTLVCTEPQDISNGHDFFVTMPAGTYGNLTISIQHAGYGVEKHSPAGATITIQRSRYFTLGFRSLDMPIPPDDGVWGLYSVSATQQVWIATGNLQFNQNISSFIAPDGTNQTGTWRFAEHQWDFVGYGGNKAGTVEGSNNDNSNGWIDQFAWGATGYNGNAPLPRITDMANYPAMPSTIADTYYDWGEYCIGEGWRTLSGIEWGYLYNGANRNGGTSKVATATVNGVSGLILLPDIWNGPALPSTGFNGYDAIVFTAEQWAEYEAFGAAFLPVTNTRTGGSSIYNSASKDGGYYWAANKSTPYNGFERAYTASFSATGQAFRNANPRPLNSWLSVRLVKNYVPASSSK